MYNGIIFDFNGVLWWDSLLQEKAWKEFATSLRDIGFTDEEMSIHLHGRNNKHTLEFLTKKNLSEPELEELTDGKESKYRELCIDQGENFRLSPGAEELLDFLKENNIPRTIATASEINNLNFFIENLHLDKWFEFEKIVYDDGTHPGKPAPDIYQKAAKNIGLETSECIVIEDAKSGIAAAHAAGIGKIIAIGPKEKHSELSTLPGVSMVIESMKDLNPEELFN